MILRGVGFNIKVRGIHSGILEGSWEGGLRSGSKAIIRPRKRGERVLYPCLLEENDVKLGGQQ
jgi:hypothetical protein